MQADASQGLPEDKVGAVQGATVADGPRFLSCMRRKIRRDLSCLRVPGPGATQQ